MSRPVHYHLGKFPPTELDWRTLMPLVGRANAALGRYDGLLRAIPNAAVLLSPLTTQEAVLSSKIEGTNVTMGEVLELAAGGEPANMTQPRRDDVEEILNYRIALNTSEKELAENKPLSLYLIRQAHAQLMQGVRGAQKSPGRFRIDQNWIGAPGCTTDQAGFVPVAPECLQSGLQQWESYLNTDTDTDPLIQLAMVHVEFEALHPFRDGNGRLGRMMIPLFLYRRGLLNGPNFYMSAYLEANRDSYIERLRAVSRDGAWTEWVRFFLQGVMEQASENQRKAYEILGLYERAKQRIVELTHSQHAIRAEDFLFQNPIFSATDFIREAQIPKPSAQRILNVLRNSGMLHTLRPGRGRRTGIFAFPELLNITEGRRVL